MRGILATVITLLTPLFLIAQLRADFTYAQFYAPGQGAYVETYFNFDGTSVTYDTVENGFQSQLNLSVFFEQDSLIKSFKKYEVLGPVVSHPDTAVRDFIDQQRFLIPKGSYTLNLELIDAVASTDTIKAAQDIVVYSSDREVFFSDVLFVQEHRKAEPGDEVTHSGLSIVPYVFDVFPTGMDQLTYYTEFYNLKRAHGDSAAAVIKYYINDVTRGEDVTGYGGFKRIEAKDVNVLFGSLNIAQLAAGNYELRFEAILKDGTPLKQQAIRFTRFNDNVQARPNLSTGVGLFEEYIDGIKSRDSLQYMMMCVVPIANQSDQYFIRKNRKNPDNDVIRNFISNFWVTQSPLDPYSEWKKYELQVQKVDNEFSTQNRPGYETDRGYIYLRYGEPNTIRKQENEPNSYPYHIWHFYKHPKRSDARYIFYSTELSTNDYRLLHSNVIGEVNNPRWQRDLQRRSTPFGNSDDENVEDQWGSWSEDLFTLPR